MRRRAGHPGLCLLLWSLLLPAALPAADAPFADVHLHYSWDQAEGLDAATAVQRLRDNDVVLGVVSSHPPQLALELQQAGGDWIIPLYQPYLDAGGRFSWYLDKRVPDATREALASGRFLGIGEIHLTAGTGPRLDNEILNAVIRLAIEFDVPVLIHTETSSHRYFLPLCQRYPQARFLWAHAGGLLDATEVGALLGQCDNVWVEFAARDHWKYVNSPIVDGEGRLLPSWVALIRQYPDRFMTGSDPLWPVYNRHNWSEPDTGWDMMDELIGYHRTWLASLPAELEAGVRLRNAQRFFRNPGRTPD